MESLETVSPDSADEALDRRIEQIMTLLDRAADAREQDLATIATLTAEVAALRQEVERLRPKVETLTQERDDAVTKARRDHQDALHWREHKRAMDAHKRVLSEQLLGKKYDRLAGLLAPRPKTS